MEDIIAIAEENGCRWTNMARKLAIPGEGLGVQSRIKRIRTEQDTDQLRLIAVLSEWVLNDERSGPKKLKNILYQSGAGTLAEKLFP